MTNECKLVVETAPPISFTVAEGAGIEKGTTLLMSDPRTAAAATTGTPGAGIAAAEKIASDGNTTLGVYREGWFKGLLADTTGVTVGDALAWSGSNTLRKAVAADTASDVIGLALETAATAETFLFELKIGAGNNAYT